jgi:hypothetical protein
MTTWATRPGHWRCVCGQVYRVSGRDRHIEVVASVTHRQVMKFGRGESIDGILVGHGPTDHRSPGGGVQIPTASPDTALVVGCHATAFAY